jgi:hypothetical protein
LHAGDLAPPDHPVPGWKEFFDIGGEANLPTWWNSTLLALVAVAAMAVSMLWSDVQVATRRAWWVVAAAATYLSMLIAVGRHLPRTTAASLAVALGAYGAGERGLEAVNGWIRRRSDDSPWYTLGTIVEESLEMGACILAVTAIVDTVAATQSKGTITLWPRHLR